MDAHYAALVPRALLSTSCCHSTSHTSPIPHSPALHYPHAALHHHALHTAPRAIPGTNLHTFSAAACLTACLLLPSCARLLQNAHTLCRLL